MSFWQGKSAIVTGAGSGIGKALSAGLAARGAKVWLSDVNGAAAEAAAKEIGADARSIALDVTDRDAIQAHVDAVAAEHGSLDAIFNNAGIGAGGDIRDLTLDVYERTIDINIRGVIYGIHAAFPHMQRQGSGIIVSTASAAGLIAAPLLAPYAMSKHAVVGLSNSLRLEAAEHGIQMNALCPVAIETPLLDNETSRDLGVEWRPDIRGYLTEIGGPPYPVEKFVDYALAQIERNKGVIVAPLGGRIRLFAGRLFPGVVGWVTRRAYRKQLATRPAD